MNGKKSNQDSNEIIPGSSLKQAIQNLPDFKEEVTLLQYRAHQLEVQLRCSPKYHPEIAGEAIEFCWAASKNTYRRYKLEDKRTKAKFVSLVDECQKIVTKQAVRVFGRRLRRYILAYHAIELAKQDQENTGALLQADNGDIIHLPAMSYQLVERLVKRKRSHRNIADSEKAFLKYIMPLMKKTSAEIT